MNELVVQPEENEQETLFDMLPKFLQEKAEFIHHDVTDDELESKLFHKTHGHPDLFSMRLKLAFWDEYEMAMKSNRSKISVNKLIQGVCTLTNFRKFIDDKVRLTWLLRMPADYRIALADIHQLSLAQLREIMTMENYDDKGQPNVKLLDVKMKVAQHVDMRLKGAIIQRIDQRNLNMNVNADADPGKEQDIALSMDEIEKRLAGLKQKSKSLQVPGQMTVDLLSGITAEGDIIEVHAPQKPIGG